MCLTPSAQPYTDTHRHTAFTHSYKTRYVQTNDLHMYIHTCTYIYSVRTYIRTCIYIYTCTCTYTSVHMATVRTLERRKKTQRALHSEIYICIYSTCTCTCTCTYMHLCTSSVLVSMHIRCTYYTCMYIHVYMYMYVYPQVRWTCKKMSL